MQRENVSHLTDEFERTRDDLVATEKSLRRARLRVRSANEDVRAMQDCVGRVADENEAGPQTVIFGFLDVEQGRQISLDEAEWYFGDDAHREAREDRAPEPDLDYHIRNDDHSRTSVEVAEDVVVVTTTADRHNIPAPKCRTWSEFLHLVRSPDPFRSRIAGSPWWVTLKEGIVVRLYEQYLP